MFCYNELKKQKQTKKECNMIYFVRHGETNLNKEKKTNGTADIPLNEHGVLQAEETAQKLASVPFDVVYCSPLLRAQQTCKAINQFHNLTIHTDERLKERNYGIYESKVNTLEDRTMYWNFNQNNEIEGGEKVQDFFARVYDFYNEVQLLHPNKNILVVAHGGVGRATHCYFNEIPHDGNLLNVLLKNCDVKEYAYPDMQPEFQTSLEATC